MSEITIRIGNNIDVLKEYPDNHFDSIVTDAPYGLGKEPNAVKLLQDWIDHGYHEITGKGFMGKEWDAFVPQPIFWKECLRVLKIGGHLLCFFGTRTYDWGTLAIRLAGFEIRDMITWHYGSGFPKSMAIDKAIDKAYGLEREVISKGKSVKRMIPGADQDKTGSWLKDNGREFIPTVTAPASEQAIKYEGWGTALKPATENICVARKPILGTVSDNMIKYGTGGINIDGCRVEFKSEEDLASATFGRGTDIMGGNYVGAKHGSGKTNIEANPQGRFPANVIFDPFTAKILDEQAPDCGAFAPVSTGKEGKSKGIYGDFAEKGDDGASFYNDRGGASRFFYVAKASTSERNAGCEHLGELGNSHPTVKPIALIQYLQRLVTPVGGLTLDPFAGSGTSGCSAALEEFNIVLIEREEGYAPIIESRTIYWQKEAKRLKNLKLLMESQQTLF